MNHLMADTTKGYHVRAVTRNTSSPKAKALADRGVEIFQGDLQHKDTLVKVWLGPALRMSNALPYCSFLRGPGSSCGRPGGAEHRADCFLV